MGYRIYVGGRELEYMAGESLLATLQRGGIGGVDAPCGGNGVCGKCTVYVTGAVEINGERHEAEHEPLHACRVKPLGDCFVETVGAKMVVVESGADKLPTDGGDGLAFAVDIGTTTVAAYLYDRTTGELLAVESGTNLQRAYGADVISRISYANTNTGGLENMRDMIRKQIDEALTAMCARVGHGRDEVKSVAIAGNTVMEHILTGLDPSGIGVAPFTPQSLFGYSVPARELGIDCDAEVFLADAVAGYVGGDITAGLLSSGAAFSENPCLFLDIGTNGEMAVGNRDGLLCCATAAGPAFEGAEMEFGMSGVSGAISKVSFENGELKTEVIGGGAARGICGSGYIDALAVMLDIGAVDETGRMLDADEAEELAAPYIEEDAEGRLRFRLAEGVYMTAADVRKLQLAKAAIRAGIELMLKDSGISTDRVERLYLAGGFGNFIDCHSAAKLGILPSELVERTVAVGNSAGVGASMLSLSAEARENLHTITEKCRYEELSNHKGFTDAFMEAMVLEES